MKKADLSPSARNELPCMCGLIMRGDPESQVLTMCSEEYEELKTASTKWGTSGTGF
jgi:hypothetical protein